MIKSPVAILYDENGIPLAVAEDDPSIGGESSILIAGVRNDTGATKTSADGDYSNIALDAAGRVGIASLGGSLTVDNSTLSVIGGGTEATALRVTIANDSTGVLSVDDNGGSITIDTPQLPAALVGGRLDENLGAWLGSTAPTVGQKTMADSIPVVLASDQTAISVTATSDTTVVEDNSSVGGEFSTLIAGVRNDTAAIKTSADGDYGNISLDSSGRVGISDLGGSITIDNSTLSVIGGGTEATALRVTIANDSTGVLSIDDNGGSVTIDGTVSATLAATIIEDTASTGGESSILIAGVRNDTAVAQTSADGDYGNIALDAAGRVGIADLGGSISIDDNAGSLTIDNSTLSVIGGGVEAAALRVTIANDSTGVLSIDDNSGSITVDGTVAATLSATVIEDDVSVGGESSLLIAGVRNDAAVARTSTDGDFGNFAIDAAGRIGIADLGGSISVDDNAGSLTVDNPTLSVVGGGAEATALRVTIANDSTGVLSVDDNGGSLTIDTPQLPAVLVGGRLDENVGAWLGSTAPTVGQKTMANSIPVAIASDQAAIPVTGTVSTTVSSTVVEDAPSASGADSLLIAGVRNDAAATLTSADGDYGNIALDLAGRVGIADLGGSISVDDNAGSLTIDNSTLSVIGGGAETTALRVTIANDSTGVLSVDDNGGSITVDGTVTATISSTVIEDAASVGGEASLLVAGVRNDAAVAKTSADGDYGNIALDAAGRVGIADLGGSISVDDNAGSLTVDTPQLPAALVGGRLDENIGAWLGSTAPTVGQKIMASSIPVVIASDQSTIAVAVSGSVSIFGTVVEDAASVGGESSVLTAGVRNDTAAAKTSADGDYGSFAIDAAGRIGIADLGGSISIDDNAGSLTIDNPTLSVVGGGVEATALRVTIATDSTGVLSVDDNGGSITVDGTVTATLAATVVEDVASAGGESSLLIAGVRNDTAAAKTSADGDFGNFAIDAAGRIGIADLGGSISVDDNAGSLTIDNSTLSVVGGGVEATALRVTIATDSTGVLSVDDNGGSLTVDGTISATLAATVIEDAASVGAESSLLIAGVRNDTATAKTSADGDYGNLALDAAGRVGIADLGGSISIDDNAGSLTVDTPQLPAALVGGRLDENIGAWLGSTAPTVGQKTMANSVPVVLPSDQTLSVTIAALTSSTATTSTVAASASSVLLLALNTSRKGAAIYNDSTKTLYLKLGTTASTTDFTTQIGNDGYYEIPFGYTGRIDGIWSAASGNARITELS